MKTINNSVGTRSNYPFKMPTHFELPTLYFDQVGGKMENQNGTIYIATNLINGKQYVGQTTKELKKRIYQHTRLNDSVILFRAIKKHDLKKFKWISYSCPKKDLDWHEKFLIKELVTQRPNGYNIEGGGKKNKIVAESTKKLISDSQMGENNSMFGTISPWRGKSPSLEVREKMKQAQKIVHLKGDKHPLARRVLLISPAGEQFNFFGTCYQFCKDNNLNFGHIFEVLKGKRNHHKGWTGRYLDV